MKEIEATQLLSVILDLAAAISSLRLASALLAADRKAEVTPVLIQVGEDLEKILSATQQLVDQVSPDDAL